MSSTSTAGPALVATGLHKTFVVPHERSHTIKERALHPFRRSGSDELKALQDVSFTVEQGEFFGIVGRNGSGKSTLLKCLAGIYALDAGEISVGGRLSTFIELGVGFNPELAARDNAILNAIMLGLSRSEAEERYERILDFSELHEFEDLKLKNYSSGMLVRLAFSVMIQVDADILLIDEVLAVGDASFQQKCFDEFQRLREQRRTVLLVTHDMASVRRFCDRAMLLEHGRAVMTDTAERVGARYFELNFAGAEEPVPEDDENPSGGRLGDGDAEIVEGWFEDAHGQRVSSLMQGQRGAFCVQVRFAAAANDPFFGLTFTDAGGTLVLATSSVWGIESSGSFEPGDEVTVRVALDTWFAPGRIHGSCSIARHRGGQDLLAHRARLASLVVTATQPGGGIVDLPYDFTLERRGADQVSPPARVL